MPVITWTELVSKPATQWRILSCVFDERALTRGWTYHLSDFTILINEGDQEYELARSVPFNMVALPGAHKATVNDLKQMVANYMKKYGPSCVVGFQTLAIRSINAQPVAQA